MSPQTQPADEQEESIADRVAARADAIPDDELRSDVRELAQSHEGLRSEKEELELENEALRAELAATEKQRAQARQQVGQCR